MPACPRALHDQVCLLCGLSALLHARAQLSSVIPRFEGAPRVHGQRRYRSVAWAHLN